LGLYSIADALATRLAPGIPERQRHPRFLTTIAVSLAICADFDEDTLAADRISPPWQVFEWYVVEGLVRSSAIKTEIQGLPGSLKAAKALQDKVPLSANRYLKTPSVFGFHGIYRLLSRTLEVEQAERLGETGYDLLTTWAKEQGLNGFLGSSERPGTEWRRKLSVAVKDGLEKGAVARASGWDGWNFIGRHLSIYSIGHQEAQLINQALLTIQGSFRRQVIEFLISPEGQASWEEKKSERTFHNHLIDHADPGLRDLLRVISAYEAETGRAETGRF
jgi:hypothetical protein